MRRHVATELGFIVPPLRVRDNMELRPNGYAVTLSGVRVAQGEIMPRQLLAMNPGNATAPLRGIETTEPAFGLPALWIAESQKTEAEMSGYSVVDAPTVLITHLGEMIRQHADEIISRQDVQALLDHLHKTAPRWWMNSCPSCSPSRKCTASCKLSCANACPSAILPAS